MEDEPGRKQIEHQIAEHREQHQPRCLGTVQPQHVGQQKQDRQIRAAEHQGLAEIARRIGDHPIFCGDVRDRGHLSHQWATASLTPYRYRPYDPIISNWRQR
ncbi:MAG: hypothetical protein BGN95_15705 [Sphingomonas sp. 66-10]|nr:MAG: hypothetical protein BGN95_15705 [Sphingomonas sp. 66-10]